MILGDFFIGQIFVCFNQANKTTLQKIQWMKISPNKNMPSYAFQSSIIHYLVFIYLSSDRTEVRLGLVRLGWVRLGYYVIYYTYVF